MGWVRCWIGSSFGFQNNYLCMKFTAGVTAWIKLSDTLHLTAGRTESRAISEGQTSPGRLWVTKDGEESLTVTPSHMWTYFKHRNITFFVLSSLEFIANAAFSVLFLQPHLTWGHDSSKRKHLPKEIPPQGQVPDSSKDQLVLNNFRGEFLCPGHHRNSGQIKLELEKRTSGQHYRS